MSAGRLALAVLLAATAVAPAQQLTRLAVNNEPEIRLHARGRNGVCDALRFTPDGKTLLAAGEDKMVHRWAVGDTLTPAGSPLSWNTFRERRGSIYALAHDPVTGQVAVAGFGKLDADVAVLDPMSGAIVGAVPYPTDAGGVRSAHAQHTVWSLAFRPDGKELATGDDAGNVWAWKLVDATARLVVKGGTVATEGSRVMWVGYRADGELLYARRDGTVSLASGGPLFSWAVAPIDRVVSSGDGRVLAARPLRGNAAGSVVEVRPLDGGSAKTVAMPANHFPDRIALDATGKRLAVGLIDYTGRPGLGFKHDRPGEVRVYDLTADPPTEVAQSPRLAMCPDQIAFHPDGRRLATADAGDHGTSLWTLAGTLTRTGGVPSDTRAVWGVGVTADGKHLCLKTAREPSPTHPNRRAAGDWMGFALTGDRRGWAGSGFAPLLPEDQRAGWRVRFDPAADDRWQIVEPGGAVHALADSWDAIIDDLPRCYTFLPGPTGGVRLAVGHLWGVSVFDLRPGQKPTRVRKLTGHAGYVTSIAPTHGGQGLVTAGRDGTIAFWNLADFEHQPLFGAAFAEANGVLEVTGVAPGSPADEIGLNPKDVVTGLMADGVRKLLPRDDWPARLRSPRPDGELAIQITRGGGQPQWAKTRLLHRPAARLVPLRGDEWVLYTYRQCYYDSSANGDRAIEWLVSKDRPDKSPDVFPVGDFRRLLRKPEKVTELLTRLDREPAKPVLVEKFPPAVELTVVNPRVGNDTDPVRATVTVTPRATPAGGTSPVEAVELWLNDHHRVGVLRVPPEQQQRADQPLPAFAFTVPNSDLVAGANRLTARVLARDGSWGTTGAPKAVQLTTSRATSRRLFAVAAGVTDYNRYKISPNQDLDLLNAADDAGRVLGAWAGLRGDAGYDADPADLPLLRDGAATKTAILGHIRAAKTTARPNDVFVLVLSGHGVRGDADGRLEGFVKGADTDHWYFLTPAHPTKPLTTGDLKRPERVKEVCLSAEEAFDALAELPCWKVVLLDCCHSGQAAKRALLTRNAADAFRAGGLGPVVLAACAENQLAVEPAGKSDLGGVFSRQVVAVLGKDFPADGRLSAAALANYVRTGVSRDAARYTDDDNRPFKQDAVVTPLDPADLERLVLAEKKAVRPGG